MAQKQKLIILHGWNGSMKSWKKFISLAENKYNVQFISLPCFDKIDCPGTVWGVQEYVNYVKDKIENIEKELPSEVNLKPILLAHSFGGQIATLLIAQHPNLISRLVLCGAAVIRPKRIIRKIILLPLVIVGRILRKNKITKTITLKIRKNIYKLIGGHDYINASDIKLEIFKKITKEDLSEEAATIIPLTIILWGKKDTYTPLRQGYKLAKLIPNNKLYIQDEGKHGLHITHPQWILDKINL